MIDVNYFLTPKGKLNANWRKLIEKDPSKFDRSGYDSELDDATVLKLAIAGLSEYPKCIVCSKPASRIDSKYCGKKCSANDPEVKKKKLDAIDTVARGKKISEKLKGRNDYHSKCWDTRRELYGNTGTTDEGMESIKSRKPSMDHIPTWVYDKAKFTEMYDKHTFDELIGIIGCHFTFLYRISLEHGVRTKSRSIAEDEISEYINSLGIDCEINNRSVISPKELDIYVPSHKLAIEYDGIFWHSSNSKLTDRHYIMAHVNKTNACEDKDVHLLHIFENEWRNPIKRDIWKSVLSHKLGKSKKIYARKCTIKDIELSVAHEFCEENHLQGKCGASYAKGLFYGDELVQVATFGKPRFNRAYDTELLRLCSKKYVCIVGGASKLLKGMALISYANRRWSFGNVYDQMGMEKIDVTKPGYFYVVDGELKHRSGYMKHMLNDKLEVFDSTLTEAENCYANGLRRIWDCGNIVYRTK